MTITVIGIFSLVELGNTRPIHLFIQKQKKNALVFLELRDDDDNNKRTTLRGGGFFRPAQQQLSSRRCRDYIPFREEHMMTAHKKERQWTRNSKLTGR